jgi:hypothetical protein
MRSPDNSNLSEVVGDLLLSIADSLRPAIPTTDTAIQSKPKPSSLPWGNELPPIQRIEGTFRKKQIVTDDQSLRILNWDIDHLGLRDGDRISGLPTKRMDAIEPGSVRLLSHE